MALFYYILTCIIIGIGLLLLVLKSLYRQTKKFHEQFTHTDFILRYPNYYWKFGLLGCVFFILAFSFDSESVKLMIPIFCFILLFGFFTFYAMNWKIIVHGENLTICIPFHRARMIKFKDITSVKQKESKYRGHTNTNIKIYIGSKKICSIDSDRFGFEYFMERLHRANKI